MKKNIKVVADSSVEAAVEMSAGVTINPEELAKLRTYMTADGNADLDESLRVFAKKIKDSYKNRRDQYATLKEFIESGSSGYDMIAAKNSLRFTEDL